VSFDEKIFGIVANFLKKRKREKIAQAARTAQLKDQVSRLTLIARAITGNPIDVFPAEEEGGYKNNSFFLPATMALFPTKEDNEAFFLFRLLFLAFQKKADYNYFEKEKTIRINNEPLLKARKEALQHAPEIIRQLEEEFDWAKGKHDFFYNLLPFNEEKELETHWLYGKWMSNAKEVDTQDKLQTIADEARKAQEQKIDTILKANAVEEIISLTVDQKQQEEHVVNNYFEKVESAEEFMGGTWRDFDGEDELEEHADALDEVQMKYVVRVDDTAHSVYQADFVENTTVTESADSDAKGYHILYDEWNYTKSTYKPKHCKVYPQTQVKRDAAYYIKTIRDNQTTLTGLRKMLTTVNNKFHIQRRQNQGDEFDLDALIDLFVDVKTGHTPSDNIYLAKRKKEKDLSILLLLDISLSSDSYAANNRVIDVEKQVSILFGEILNEFGVDFSVNCFFSNTRNHNAFLTLKGFDEKWETGKHKIGQPQPQGYTRIGPALRHAGAMLKTRDTKNKWIVLLSDGKPNDYDTYEGKYGVNDVKQALRELNQIHVNTYALAIEAQAKYYLPQMFGTDHYEILTTPVELLQSLAKLYEKIKY